MCAQILSTEIFEPSFKSLQVLTPNNLLGNPILLSNIDNSRLIFSFDELADDSRYLRYRIIHCDINWQPSDISELEYVNGFNEAAISNYSFSENTLTNYVHYEFELPNEDIRPLISGNYIVQVFDESDSEQTLLQARFMVSEGIVPISASVSSRTDMGNNDLYQQLYVDADVSGGRVENPYTDLSLKIIPNYQECGQRIISAPLRASASNVIYEHQKDLVFQAGNEYRRFDISNVKYPGMHVELYDFEEPYYIANIVKDYPKANSNYQYDSTQFGRYFVSELNAEFPETQSDYILTNFMLVSPKLDKDVYIEGDLTLRQLNENSKMDYNVSLQAYTKTLLLKQGMYNYKYITQDTNSNVIEGNFYETNNEYLILLYYKPNNSRYYRLIGSTSITTNK